MEGRRAGRGNDQLLSRKNTERVTGRRVTDPLRLVTRLATTPYRSSHRTEASLKCDIRQSTDNSRSNMSDPSPDSGTTPLSSSFFLPSMMRGMAASATRAATFQNFFIVQFPLKENNSLLFSD